MWEMDAPSLRKLAPKLGVSQQTLSKINAGKVPMSEALLLRIYKELGEPPHAALAELRATRTNGETARRWAEIAAILRDRAA
ncbi:MAG: hypothetical protein ACX939_03000 [Hyphococcus sp.]